MYNHLDSKDILGYNLLDSQDRKNSRTGAMAKSSVSKIYYFFVKHLVGRVLDIISYSRQQLRRLYECTFESNSKTLQIKIVSVVCLYTPVFAECA